MPAHILQRALGNEHRLAANPVAGINTQIANRPASVVEDEIVDVADLTVAGADMKPRDAPAAVQVRLR
jgi:hypothetical protein